MSNEEEERQHDPAAPPGPARLQLSPDGRWWWDGLRWNPMPEDVVPPPPTVAPETDPWRVATDDHRWSPASDVDRWAPGSAQLWPPAPDPQEPAAGESRPPEPEGWSAASDGDRWPPASTQSLWPPAPAQDGSGGHEAEGSEPFRWDRHADDDPPPAPEDPFRWDAPAGAGPEPSAPESFQWNQQPKDWPFGGAEDAPPAPPPPPRPPQRLEDAPSELTHLREQLRHRDEMESQPPSGPAPQYQQPPPEPPPYQGQAYPAEPYQPSAYQPPAPPAPPAPPPDFHAAEFMKNRTQPPKSGVRKLLYRVSGGAVNLGMAQAEQVRERQLAQARTPVADPPARVAFASAKGGVGKSTMTLLTTSQLGLLRHDRILAVECNPHHGTFRSRVQAHHDRSVNDLITGLDQLDRDEDLTYPMLHRYTTVVDAARLETLTAPHDPSISQALGETDYRRVLDVLYRYYDLVTLDLGTGLLDSGTHYMLSRVCAQAVVVVEAALDGAELGMHTLKFLAARRGADWVRERTVVVINQVRRDGLVDVQTMENHFRQWARTCLRVHWDRHLEAGGLLQWEEVSPLVQDDFLALCAELSVGFRLGSSPDTDRPGKPAGPSAGG